MADRPNLLVFLTDDHAQWAARCYGNREISTPTMDYLAKSGVRLANAFTVTPVCSPARASFFTGRLPSQHGIHDWIHEPSEIGRRHPGIKDQVNIGMLLQATGYQTAMIGKWHCGHSWEPHPGFDRWFSYGSFQYPHKGEISFSDQGKIAAYNGYQSVAFTDKAIEYIRQRDKQRPFFLFVSFVNTHTPHTLQPERLVEPYRNATFSDIPLERFAECHGKASFAWSGDPQTMKESLAQYYAAVSFIDDQVGRILDELDGADELNNTLIVYTSDHGHMNGHHGLHTKGNATIPQNFLEESIRVPCLISWRDGLPAGLVCEALADQCDLYATLLDAAGAVPEETLSKTINSPGASYLSLLKGDRGTSWRDTIFGEYGNARMIRSATCKLIQRYPGPNGHYPDELYDLIESPRERTNCIADTRYQSEVVDLSNRLQNYFSKYEIPKHSGREIEKQPRCNSNAEPWVKTQ